jgi:hypothetical protein
MKKKTQRRKSKIADTIDWTSLSPEEEEKKIIELLDAHVNQAEIASAAKRSVNHINEINQRRLASRKPRDKSMASQAYKLFKENKDVLDVAIELGIEAPEAEEYLAQYWRLRYLNELLKFYADLGTSLGDFVAVYKEFKAKGISLDKAIEMSKISSSMRELRAQFNFLTKQKGDLSINVNQIQLQREQLTDQVYNLKSEITQKSAMVEQLRQKYDNLNSMLNSIRQGDITIQRIEQFAKEAGKSIMVSRVELVLTSYLSVIKVLKNDSKLVTLLLAPGSGLDHPILQKEALSLALAVWNEISANVIEQTRKAIYDEVKKIVNDLHK